MHPQTHGRAEKAVQEVIDQVRKFKMALGKPVQADVPIEGKVVHAMAFKKLSDSLRRNPELFDKVRGSPWCLDPSKEELGRAHLLKCRKQ